MVKLEMRRVWVLALAAALLGCGHEGTKVQRNISVDYSRFLRIGATPFVDPRGHGLLIAEKLNAGLARQGYAPPDMKDIEAILAQHKPDRDWGVGLEALETIRHQTAADAVITGALSADWSSARVTMLELEMGEQVLLAIVKPAAKKKAFADPDEVVAETLRVFAALRR